MIPVPTQAAMMAPQPPIMMMPAPPMPPIRPPPLMSKYCLKYFLQIFVHLYILSLVPGPPPMGGFPVGPMPGPPMGPGMNMPPMKHPNDGPSEDEPSNKKLRNEDSLIPENVFLSRNPVSKELQISNEYHLVFIANSILTFFFFFRAKCR